MLKIHSKKSITLLLSLILCMSFLWHDLGVAGDIPGEMQDTFVEVIQPWIRGWFMEHAFEVNIADDVKIERKLISSSLYRFEDINSQERYSVTILYHVIIKDRASKIDLWGLKEQQIVFLLNGKALIDFFPLSEYWKEDPQHKITDELVEL